jgi:hypothetical protein
MNLTVEIPDKLASQAFAADEYRHDRLSKPDLQRLIGIETSYELDGFLKAHNILIEYAMEDAERERQSLQRLGF